MSIENNRFSAEIADSGYRGQLNGVIGAKGILVVTIDANYFGYTSRLIDASFSAPYAADNFRATGRTTRTGAGNSRGGAYYFILSRTAPGRAAKSTASQTAAVPPAAAPATTPPQPSTDLYPYDGVWKGSATIMYHTCLLGGGARRFDLTLNVENGQISGGDPSGSYLAEGQVDAKGRLEEVYLTKILTMAGTLASGTIRNATRDCGGRYDLTKVAAQ